MQLFGEEGEGVNFFQKGNLNLQSFGCLGKHFPYQMIQEPLLAFSFVRHVVNTVQNRFQQHNCFHIKRETRFICSISVYVLMDILFMHHQTSRRTISTFILDKIIQFHKMQRVAQQSYPLQVKRVRISFHLIQKFVCFHFSSSILTVFIHPSYIDVNVASVYFRQTNKIVVYCSNIACCTTSTHVCKRVNLFIHTVNPIKASLSSDNQFLFVTLVLAYHFRLFSQKSLVGRLMIQGMFSCVFRIKSCSFLT